MIKSSSKITLIFCAMLIIVSLGSFIINILCFTKLNQMSIQVPNQSSSLESIVTIDVTDLPDGAQSIDVFQDGSFVISTITSN